VSKTEVGRKAPKFSLPSTAGDRFSLADARGSNLVIYFYPRDNTSGCTREAQDFRELHGAFRKANTVIVGISPDSIESHHKFKTKFKLPFALLSDEDRKGCELFDVIREKSMYGRKFMGVERSTFLIDADGQLRREWRKVKVDGHAAEVLEAAKSL
jgi:thioredoxin-dependent peroxiredoxin